MGRKRPRRGPSPLAARQQPPQRRSRLAPAGHILQLPPEVLAHVFSFLPFSVTAETLRLVCRRFRGAAELSLNAALPRLNARLAARARALRANVLAAAAATTLPGVGGGGVGGSGGGSGGGGGGGAAARRTRHLLCRAYTAVCAARAQLDLLHAATWRYTRSLRPGHAPPACFYGGRVLDDAARLLRLAEFAPEALGAAFFRRDSSLMAAPAGVLNALSAAASASADGCDRWRLLDDAKRFINHFERVTERAVNARPADWGAKVVDLLHCLVDGPRALQSYSASVDLAAGVYKLEATWRLRRTWFLSVTTGTGAGSGAAYSWREDASYMHLRVRRLVCAHNNHLLHPARHTRLLLGSALAAAPAIVPAPGSYASVYSGFGEYAGRFFYYGNMNARALRSKILHGSWPIPAAPPSPPLAYPAVPYALEDDDHEDDDEEELLAVLEADPEVDLNLYIKVELECPLRVAPYRVLRGLSAEALEAAERDGSASPYRLSIDLLSPENARQRLPTAFRWQMPDVEARGSGCPPFSKEELSASAPFAPVLAPYLSPSSPPTPHPVAPDLEPEP